MDAIITFLLEKYPLFFAGGLLIYLTYRVIRYHDRLVKTEAKCSQIKDQHIPQLHDKFDRIDSKLTGLGKSLYKISTYLLTSDKKLDPQIFVAHSPLELTPLDQTILEVTGGKAYIDSNVDKLIAVIKDQNFKSGLDVQNYANLLLIEKSENDEFTPIKDYIYHNPLYKIDDVKSFPLDMSLCFNIMGIYLRNKYFELYPELKRDL